MNKRPNLPYAFNSSLRVRTFEGSKKALRICIISSHIQNIFSLIWKRRNCHTARAHSDSSMVQLEMGDTLDKENVNTVAFKLNKLLRQVMLEQSRFQASIHSNNCVSDAIEHVWYSVSSGITEKWLRTLELPIAIDMTMLKMRKIVGWSVISHDGSLTEDALEMLISEDEPTPVSIDPWARGTVPTRREPIVSDFRHVSSITSTAPSVSSRCSSRSSFGRGMRSFTCGQGVMNSSEETSISGKIIELEEEPEFNDLDSTATMFKLLQKTKRLKLRDTKGIASETTNEFEAIQEEIGNATKDLKGKKFVIDKEGRLLTLHPVRPENLPPFAVPLRACVTENGRDEYSAASGAKKKKKVIRVAGSPSVSDLYFKAASTLATSLAGGDQIEIINPGVSIQSGGNMRTGESFPSDPRRANRKEYLRVGNNLMKYTMDDSDIELPPRNLQASRDTATESIYEVGESIYEPSGSRSAAFTAPDVDAFEGARKVPERDISDIAEESGVGTMLYGGMSTTSILSTSSSRFPSKASEKQRRNMSLLSGGPSVAGNRDRVIPQGMLSPAERTKLPAPPVGYTTGHGLLPQTGLSLSSEKSMRKNFKSSSKSESTPMSDSRSIAVYKTTPLGFAR